MQGSPCECLPAWIAVDPHDDWQCAWCHTHIDGSDDDNVRLSHTVLIPCSDVAHPTRMHFVCRVYHAKCTAAQQEAWQSSGRSDLFSLVPVMMTDDRVDSIQQFYPQAMRDHAPTKRAVYCSGCGIRQQRKRRFQRCGRCHGPYYCGTGCHHEHWSKHKQYCK